MPGFTERLHHLTTLIRDRGASEAHMRTMTFEALVPFNKSHAVFTVTNSMLTGLYSFCTTCHTNEARPDGIRGRLFLSAYLIRLHKTQVFHNAIPEVEPLDLAANALIEQYENILVVAQDQTKEKRQQLEALYHCTKGFLEKIGDFQTKYDAWKVVDEKYVIFNTKRTLLRVFGRMLQLSGDHHDINYNDPMVMQLKHCMDRLCDSLIKMVGINEVYLFNCFRERAMRERYYLRVLREEQRRMNIGHGFAFFD
jgi:hypothetical protein